MVFKDHKVLKVFRVDQGIQVEKVFKVFKVHRATKVFRVEMV
jgi:hypothetical protein